MYVHYLLVLLVIYVFFIIPNKMFMLGATLVGQCLCIVVVEVLLPPSLVVVDLLLLSFPVVAGPLLLPFLVVAAVPLLSLPVVAAVLLLSFPVVSDIPLLPFPVLVGVPLSPFPVVVCGLFFLYPRRIRYCYLVRMWILASSLTCSIPRVHISSISAHLVFSSPPLFLLVFEFL